MKNREKFKGEIVEAIKEDNDENGKMCCFLKDNVIPRFISEEDMKLSICGGIDCHTCAKMFAFWLEEEYTEPPKPEVDWSNVPVDTLVRVREREDQEWILRYFKGINDKQLRRRYEAWESGATSKTAKGKYLCWNYCELVEDEDNGSN